MTEVVRLKPLEYVHVHDSNRSVTYAVCGPLTYTLPQHETLISKSPEPFICIPPMAYAVIENPVLRDEATGELLLDSHGQVRTALGESEIRFGQVPHLLSSGDQKRGIHSTQPFPLYPGERLAERRPLMVLTATQSIVLRAARDFDDDDDGHSSGTAAAPRRRVAGDEWLFRGPGTYIPRVEHEFVELREAIIVKFNESLRLRAKNSHTDVSGVFRAVGEEYLWSKEGAYMLSVDESLVSVVPAVVLNPTTALHVEVMREFIDRRPWAKAALRLPGQVYLVTRADTNTFTPLPSERIIREERIVTVSRQQYAVIIDPVLPDGTQQFGGRCVVTNCSFFLKPGERLEKGVEDIYVLSEDEAIVLTAIREFVDESGAVAVRRSPGDTWLVTGPIEYVPHAAVQVKQDKNGHDKRRRLVFGEGEGVYVRNTQTGEVRAVTGGAFMLGAFEEPWEKELPPVVEACLARHGDSITAYSERNSNNNKIGSVGRRDRSQVVQFNVPHGSIVQIYDYKRRTQKIVFGPQQVLLGPEEHFTVLTLSGSEWDPKRPEVCLPKQPGKITTLYLFLGPMTMADVVNVETCDHARLELQLSYNWYFDVKPGNVQEAEQCFSVPDFVGDCCSCIASRIRSSVASIPFDQFHRHFATIVPLAVFGSGGSANELRFSSNRLVVTAVDVQGMMVLDEKTRVALFESVKRAIQSTTQSQEAAARQEASVREQQAQGMLDRQIIADKSEAERIRKALIELESHSAGISSSGRAKAEAQAHSEATVVDAQSSVTLARRKAQAQATTDNMASQAKAGKTNAELTYRKELEELELTHQRAMSQLESGKFGRAIQALGRDTITALARAGPELQARLLKSLGLQGYLVTDGTSPINLFNAAQGLSAAAATAPPAAS